MYMRVVLINILCHNLVPQTKIHDSVPEKVYPYGKGKCIAVKYIYIYIYIQFISLEKGLFFFLDIKKMKFCVNLRVNTQYDK